MFNFKVTPDGQGSYVVSAGTRDILIWEKTAKNRSVSNLMEAFTMQDAYSLAHAASKRQGLFTGSLSDFESQCDMEIVAEDEPDPTNPDR
ncbi:hypothetical protein AD006_01180 [Pseudonocardia sp. EC080610-09]|uniref:hypothetical protein n=1 Tax=unclassified Pseudonocardia TaxID=2619320 RepID=UPI0006CB26C4|nr:MULTISPECIES: hypothetical protein [unclassified Pseudonocardia]ALE74935.1 hypothetical protein FRP1_21980 [Pseudonocardia sp. EC080625-04]ALL74279.1 hypothetical protein AD006_01180 [Pseudonocardia sp. EC080610-09]ALL81302.1 hypothetical protein AD017_09005 [Pseudonocardia sp. EC080619-01]